MFKLVTVVAVAVLTCATSTVPSEARTIRMGALCIEGINTDEFSIGGDPLAAEKVISIHLDRRDGSDSAKFFLFGPPTAFAPPAEPPSWKWSRPQEDEDLIFELMPPPRGMSVGQFREAPNYEQIFKDLRSKVANAKEMGCLFDGIGGRPVLMTGTVDMISAAGMYSGSELTELEEFRFRPGAFRMTASTLDVLNDRNGVTKQPLSKEQIDEFWRNLKIPTDDVQDIQDVINSVSSGFGAPGFQFPDLTRRSPLPPAGPLAPEAVKARQASMPLGGDWSLGTGGQLTLTNIDPTWSARSSPAMRFRIEASGLALSGIYLGLNEKALLGQFATLDNEPVIATFDLAYSQFRSIDGDFSAKTSQVADVAFHNVSIGTTGARIETDGIAMKLADTSAALTFANVGIDAENLALPTLNMNARDLVAEAEHLELSGPSIGAYHFYPDRTKWTEVTGHSPVLTMRFGDSPVSGEAKFSLAALDETTVAKASLDVTISQAGSFPYLVGSLSDHKLSLQMDGALNDPSVKFSISELPLTLGNAQLSLGQTTSVTEFEWDRAAKSLPFDIVLQPSEAEATLRGSADIKLTGRVFSGRLKGALTFENGTPELKFEPGGLNLSLGGAVAAGPWVAGSKPQFADLKVELNSPNGLLIKTKGLEGNLELSTGVVTLLDPAIQVATGLPSLTMKLPLVSDAGVELEMSFPGAKVVPIQGHFRTSQIEAFSEEGSIVDIGDIAARGVHLTADEISLSFEGKRAEAQLSNLKLEAAVIEYGGRAGTRSPDRQLYIAARPGEVLAIESLTAAAVDLGKSKGDFNDKIAMGVTKVAGLQMVTGHILVQSSDGFSYEGDGARLSITRLDAVEVNADFSIGKGLLKHANETDGMGTLNTNSMSAHIEGATARPKGDLHFEIADLDYTAPIALKVTDDCNVNHSDNSIRFDATLKVPTFMIVARLAEDGTVSGVAKLNHPTVRVALSRGFNCSFTENIDIEIKGSLFGIDYVIFRGSTTMTFEAILDSFRLGYGFQEARASLSKGKMTLCASFPHIEEAPLTALAVSVLPFSTGVDWADHFLAEAIARVSQPIQSAFVSATGTILVSWPQLRAAIPGGWTECL